jgi:hypothetical protein
MKKLIHSTRLQLTVVGTLMLASCAQTIDPQYRATEDELKTMKQAQTARTADGAMAGAAMGAATGAGLAALKGGDKKDIAKGAMAGGLVGGLGGGMLGFQKGDKDGKEKVSQKRSQKELEKEVLARIDSNKKIIFVQNQWLAKLRAMSANGVDPKIIKKTAKDLLSKIDTSNTNADPQFKEAKGYQDLAGLNKKSNDLTASIKEFSEEGEKAKTN